MRRTSVLFPYIRAAAFHVPKDKDKVQLMNSVLGYFAAGEYQLLKYLTEAVKSENV